MGALAGREPTGCRVKLLIDVTRLVKGLQMHGKLGCPELSSNKGAKGIAVPWLLMFKYHYMFRIWPWFQV